MAKRTTFSMPLAGSALGAAKGAGFDVDNIAVKAVDVVTGDASANEIVGQVMEEGKDVIQNFTRDPLGTQINVAVGAAVPLGLSKLFGYGLDMFGLPKAKNFGKKFRLVWAL